MLEIKHPNHYAEVIMVNDIRPVEGSDNLGIVKIHDAQVLVNKHTVQEGDKMVYIMDGIRLNEYVASLLNLYSDPTMNHDKTVKGYLGKNGVVRSIKLRGEMSHGVLLSLKGIVFSDMNVGDKFTHIHNAEICGKPLHDKSDETKTTANKLKKKNLLLGFEFHGNTPNIYRGHTIRPDDYISIHYKKHGTSFVLGNLPIKRSFWQRLKAAFTDEPQPYDFVVSSRTVIRNMSGNDIYARAAQLIRDHVPKGYTLYGEIIGFDNEKYIQSGFDYGCKPYVFRVFIYKISVQTPDGPIYLSDQQILEFCKRSPTLEYKETLLWEGRACEYMTNNDPDTLVPNLVKEYVQETDCTMCKNKVPAEGIVVRKESMKDYIAFKLKSKKFIEQHG